MAYTGLLGFARYANLLDLHFQAADVIEDNEEEIPRSSSLEASIRSGICAICLDKIVLEETALVKGCEHAYCATCILRWASYSSKNPTCPQCKLPFEFLVLHRTLDGCIRDFMFEESVCLLLRAQWFVPLAVPADGHGTTEEDLIHFQCEEEYDDDDDDDDDDAEDYYVVASRTSSLLIRNRRWGENGYIRGGRKEARPVNPSITLLSDASGGSSSSSGYKGKAPAPPATEAAAGRRAKRAMKREAADKAAAAKHQLRLERLGRV